MSGGEHVSHLRSILESQLPPLADLGGSIVYVRDGLTPGVRVHSGSAWGPITTNDVVVVIATGDGVTDVTSLVATAVNTAFASGKELYWPAGTYLTASSLANFHSVVHRGPGMVKRGANLFSVDPSMHAGATNNLYVATTGNDANDGLSSSEPRVTTLSMGNVIYAYPYGNITWKVNIAAGTYTENVSFFSAFPSPNRVQFLGATVSAGVQPTTIFQASGGGVGNSVVGMYFQNQVRFQVSDVNMRGYKTNALVDANLLSAGITMDVDSEGYTVNVWTDDCDIGIFVQNGSNFRIQAGRHGFNTVNGTNIGIGRHTHGNVGYGGSAASATGDTGVALIGGAYGVSVSEFGMAHTDYCYFSGQTLAGLINNMSRTHSVSSTFINCLIGIDGRMNANVGITTCTFTTCTTDTVLRSGAIYAGVTGIAEGLYFSPIMKQMQMVAQSTQSAAPVAITLPSGVTTVDFVAKEFQSRGMGFTLTMHGNCTGAANTKTVIVKLNTAILLTATIAAATTNFKIVVKVATITSNTSQYLYTEIIENGATPTVSFTTALAEALDSASTLTATFQVTNVADLIRLGMLELEEQH